MKSVLLLIVILSVEVQQVYAQKIKTTKAPAWVKLIEIPKTASVSKYDFSSGYYTVLIDNHINLKENWKYYHDVISVYSYSGITKASQVMITYDTSYQHVEIHHLYIWRKGAKMDRTGDLSFEIMNNEFNLHNGIYTGRITAYDNLDDIRKDDLIDFAYSVIGKNPILGNEKFILQPLESDNPIDKVFIRVLYDGDKDYEYKCVQCDSTVNILKSVTDKQHTIEIVSENVKAVQLEDHLPSWEIPYKYFTLTSFKSWKEVNYWASEVFALKQEPRLDEVFKEIFSGNETTEEKINKAIDFVQDDIRYMGIESGIGSIKPSPPEQVIKQRFGDCKDKSLLLVSMLKKLGVSNSYPVLVNTGLQHELEKQYPSNEVFNHCIVHFEYKNELFWIDPTHTLQGGEFSSLFIKDYGKVLVIGKPSDSLNSMNHRKTESGTKVVRELNVTSFSKPAKMKITAINYGEDADDRRMFMEQNNVADLEKSVIEDLKLIFPVVNKTEEIVIEDDPVKNVFKTIYSLEVDKFWIDGDQHADKKYAGYWIFKFEPRFLYSYFGHSACTKREHDINLTYPLNLKYELIFNLPKEMLIYDDYTMTDNEAFTYDQSLLQLSANSFSITYNYISKSKLLKASAYEEVCEERNKIYKSLPFIIYINK
jgi:hypothetical protein